MLGELNHLMESVAKDADIAAIVITGGVTNALLQVRISSR
jgi:hypothetical protein